MNKAEIATVNLTETTTSQSNNEIINVSKSIVSDDDPLIEDILSLYTCFRHIIPAKPELVKSIRFYNDAKALRRFWQDDNLIISRDLTPVLENGKWVTKKEFTIFKNHWDVQEYVTSVEFSERIFYEAFMKTQFQKPRFDLDLSHDKYPNITKEGADWFLTETLRAIDIVMHLYRIDYSFQNNCLVFSSHGIVDGHMKYSFHIVIDKLYHVDHKEAKAFYRKVYDTLPEDMVKTFLDEAVYSSFQNFRLVCCQKIDSGRIKILDPITVYKPGIQSDDPIIRNRALFQASLVSCRADCEPLPTFSDPKAKLSNRFVIPDAIPDQIAKMLQLFQNQPYSDQYTVANSSLSYISLNRIEPGICPIHNRVHDKAGAYITENANHDVWFNCYREKARGLLLGNLVKLEGIQVKSEMIYSPPEYRVEGELVPLSTMMLKNASDPGFETEANTSSNSSSSSSTNISPPQVMSNSKPYNISSNRSTSFNEFLKSIAVPIVNNFTHLSIYNPHARWEIPVERRQEFWVRYCDAVMNHEKLCICERSPDIAPIIGNFNFSFSNCQATVSDEVIDKIVDIYRTVIKGLFEPNADEVFGCVILTSVIAKSEKQSYQMRFQFPYAKISEVHINLFHHNILQLLRSQKVIELLDADLIEKDWNNIISGYSREAIIMFGSSYDTENEPMKLDKIFDHEGEEIDLKSIFQPQNHIDILDGHVSIDIINSRPMEYWLPLLLSPNYWNEHLKLKSGVTPLLRFSKHQNKSRKSSNIQSDVNGNTGQSGNIQIENGQISTGQTGSNLYIPYDLNDHYYYPDFVDEFSGKTFTTFDAKKLVEAKASRVVRHILGTKTYYLKMSETNPFHRVQASDCLKIAPYHRFTIICDTNVNGEMKETKYSFNILDGLKGTNLYSISEVWKPFHMDQYVPGNIREEFNTFPGFVAKLVQYDINIIRPILEHIRVVWASGNYEYYRYILSLLAYSIRHLTLPGVVLALVGVQGTGKSNIFNIIVKHVYGIKLSHSTAGLDDILQKFNAHLDGKMCIVVNEAEASDGSGNHNFGHMFNKFKNYVTDEFTAVEPKGQEIRAGKNYRAYYICTNHKSSIHIESDDDRRFAVFETLPIFKGNFEYFKILGDACNQTVGDHLYSYFRSSDFDAIEVSDIRNIPLTPIKQSLIERTMPYSRTFINEIMNGERALSFNEIKFYKREPVFSTTELHTSYLEWLRTQDPATKAPKSMRNFGDHLNSCPYLEKIPSQIRIDGQKIRAYKILPSAYNLVQVEFVQPIPNWVATHLITQQPSQSSGTPRILDGPIILPLIHLVQQQHE
jgi:hypothetical protein